MNDRRAASSSDLAVPMPAGAAAPVVKYRTPTRTVLKRWVIHTEPNGAPVRDGSFATERELLSFLESTVRRRSPATQIVVARLTWNHDLWVQEGRSYLAEVTCRDG